MKTLKNGKASGLGNIPVEAFFGEDVAPTTEGLHDGRGWYPGHGPRPDGVETEDKADTYEIGKIPLKVSKVSTGVPEETV